MSIDAGNRLSQATAIAIRSTRTTYRDSVSKTDEDFYRLQLRQRSSFNLRLNGLLADADVELIQDRNRNGKTDRGEVVASSRASDRRADPIRIVGLLRGTYFVRVFPKAGGATNYQLTLAATPTTQTSFAYDTVRRTNALRQANGLPALAVNTQLTNAAQAYARSMAFQDFFSHTGADGSSPWDRIKAADYDYSQAAENLAAGHTTPASTMQGWINSPGHRANLLAYQVQEIGVGYFYLENDGGDVTFNHYWSQSMGTPTGATPSLPNVPDDN
jgi:uncharacterized protein YkwD